MRHHNLRELIADNRGNVLILVAAALPLLFGAAAFGIDMIQLSLAKRELQRKADTAALAGAHAVAQNKAASAAATRVIGYGDQVTLHGAAVVNNAPVTGAYVGKSAAVEVILKTRPPVVFLPMFTGSQPILIARAVASKVGGSPVCILSLDPTVKYGIEMTGNANMNLACSIASNSNHQADSLRLTGNLALAEVAEVQAVGNIEVSGNASVPGAQRFPNSAAQADPHASLPTPPRPSSCDADKRDVKLSSGTHTLQPGNYCGTFTIDGSAKVVFAPGTYVMATEYMKINGGSNSSVTGQGVTIIPTQHHDKNDKWSYIDWNGDTTINLAAPKVSSGSPYAGVLIYQNRDTPASVKNYFNGNIKMTLRGSIYFPSTWFEWNGNTSSNTDCLRIIADQMYLNGNIDIQNDCTVDDGVMNASQIKRVRLVE